MTGDPPPPADFETIDAAPAALVPSAGELLRACGYAPGAQPAWDPSDAAGLVALAVDLARPRAGFRRCALRVAGTELHIAGGAADAWTALRAGDLIAPVFEGCDAVAVFACSIGDAVERRARALMDAGDGPRGYLLDTIASHMAEALAEAVSRGVEASQRALGRSCTRRVSPGYCGWSVAEQHALFSLLPPGCCGITLTASAFMHPVKSVSGLIGLLP